MHTAKDDFAVCFSFAMCFFSTLGKIYVCGVPVNLHTANFGAHGKSEISGSASKPFSYIIFYIMMEIPQKCKPSTSEGTTLFMAVN